MLKEYDELLRPDSRYSNVFQIVTLEELHSDMLRFELPPTVPASVRQLHDAIRHAYIYSYFSYELLRLATAQALPCLELALKERMPERKGAMLAALLKEAKQKRFIRSPTDGLYEIRNEFAHGSEAFFDPNGFLSFFGCVSAIIAELYEPNSQPSD